MNVRLITAPWSNPTITSDLKEAIKILGDNIWAESSVEFYANREAKINAGKPAPKGMQQTLNTIIDQRFYAAGWIGDSGYYVKNATWIRVTFRHQMSLGSDIIDALKVCKKEGIKLAVILAASRRTLGVISPNDAAALVSFEKLNYAIMSLDGAMDIPLLIGELTPKSKSSQVIEDSLHQKRPRDLTIPSKKKIP